MKVYFDIETIPTQNLILIDQIRATIKPPGNITKEDTKAQWIVEKGQAAFEKEYRKTSLSGTTGEIISIAWGVEDQPIRVVYRELNQPESKMLADFFVAVSKELIDNNGFARKPIWVGHNICDFDLRFLWQRCVVNHINPPIPLYHNDKPWSPNVIDTLYEWTGLNKAGGSLNKICLALGMEGKGDIDGSKVWDYVKAGKVEEVAHYNKDDVQKVKDIYQRMIFS